MLFNSIPYLLFFPVVFCLFWLAPDRFRRPILLAASYVFYMSWIPAYGVLIGAMTIVNYALAMAMVRWQSRSKQFFIVGVAANLATLCFFKYTNFLISSFLSAASMLAGLSQQGTPTPLPPSAIDIILPLGISFFAFEFIHYLTDVYKGGEPIRGFVDFSLFAAFFPSQIAGPIKRYQDFVHQLAAHTFFDKNKFHEGMSLFLQGLFKKAALADNLSPFANAGFAHAAQLGCFEALFAVMAFTFEIYFDFSGYTDMGRGSALMLGFSLPDNFNFPYLACSLQDFWKRWHISLSSWLRDYLYIPLGGNRGGKLAKYKNLLLTMVLGGLWHGAAWHFAIWGSIHGLGLVINHTYDDLVKRREWLQFFHSSQIGLFLSAVLTFSFVILGWIFFRADNVSQACNMIGSIFSFKQSGILTEMVRSSTVVPALVVYSIYASLISWRRTKLSSRTPLLGLSATSMRLPLLWQAGSLKSALSLPARAMIYAGVFLSVVGFAPATPSPFIYFQF